jgi:hypothetical protein
MIICGDFEKVDPAIETLNHALCLTSVVSSRCFGGPGEVIKALPTKEREVLKNLTADMLNKYRVNPWQIMGHAWVHYEWYQEQVQAFDREIFKHRKVEI